MSMETVLQTSERIAEFVDNLDSIITLPEISARIMATVNNPKSTPADLHRIISHDPALVARVLKLVNSSLYRRVGKIDSVERAIVLLGFDAVRNLAVSSTFGRIFAPVDLCSDYSARDLWTHCVAVAATARELAKRACEPLADQVFLAGLVHDVGLLVELQVCPDKLRAVCQAVKDGAASFSSAEYEKIGCTHAELGAALAERWGFPEFCRAAAAYHHHPALAEPDQQQIVSLVYAADTLCCHHDIGFNLTAAEQIADTVADEHILPLSNIQEVADHLPELIGDTLTIYNV